MIEKDRDGKPFIRWNGVKWGEHTVANWLATRLERVPHDPQSDWNVLMAWDKRHQFALMDKLKDVNPDDRKKINRIFGEYARVHGLLNGAELAAREIRLNPPPLPEPPHRTTSGIQTTIHYGNAPLPTRRKSLLRRINDYRLF